DAVRAKDSKYASMSAAELRNTEDYQKAFGDYGIGGKYQMVAQSVSGILAGAAGGDFNKALAGGLNPVMAQVIKGATTDGNKVDEPANLMAHAVWGALAAQLSGGNAAAGAAGAFSGELAARHIAAEMFPNTKPGDLNQDQKQLVSLLGTMAAGIAGGVVGNSTAAATTGAQAGKNAVENNAASPWGALVPSRTQEEASLAFSLGDKGVARDKITKAIEKSHLNPPFGDVAKIKGDMKGQVVAGVGAGGYLESVLSEDKFAINGGVTKAFGWRADASVGLTFGPYPIKDFSPSYDYAGSLSAGIISVEGSIGKDGIGGSLRFGGGIGASFRQSENHNNQPELNGSGSTEIMSWPIKKD
ncbi:polymorphic toxin type 25 domain-containing protein, partial [Cedecea sp. VD21]